MHPFGASPFGEPNLAPVGRFRKVSLQPEFQSVGGLLSNWLCLADQDNMEVSLEDRSKPEFSLFDTLVTLMCIQIVCLYMFTDYV